MVAMKEESEIKIFRKETEAKNDTDISGKGSYNAHFPQFADKES